MNLRASNTLLRAVGLRVLFAQNAQAAITGLKRGALFTNAASALTKLQRRRAPSCTEPIFLCENGSGQVFKPSWAWR